MGTWWATWKIKIIAGVAILAALAIAIFAAHTIGYNKGKNISKVEIASYEGKVKKLEAELTKRQTTTDIKYVTKYITDTQYIDRIVYQNRDVIRTEVVSRPVQYTVTQGFLYAHNQSALGLPIDPVLARNATPSQLDDPSLLIGIAENYGICRTNKANLEALQKWAKETHENSLKVSK